MHQEKVDAIYEEICNYIEESPVDITNFIDYSSLYTKCFAQVIDDLTAEAENRAEEAKYEGYDNE